MEYTILVDGRIWYTYQQLASLEKVTHRCVHKWAKSGKIDKIDFDGVTFYRMRDVE